MNISFDNSFFHQDLHGLKVLVIVPHEDDEINTCGSLLRSLSVGGAYITLVYTTNGDWKYSAVTRMKESVESARLFGIHKDRIVFLGYGDSLHNEKHNHIFYAVNKPAKSEAGHTETYGTYLYKDYSFVKRGRHQPYTYKGFLEDIISVIDSERADLIICTDFDEHLDHKMLSLVFDKAIGMVCRKDKNYHPEIWKSFAYSLAYLAVPDYTSTNNPETKRPNPETTDKYKFDIIDKSFYVWNQRLRIPVAWTPGGRIKTQFITSALMKHKSQHITTRADRIINSDEVYWRRRTDNLSFSATVSVSSGNGSYLNDFILYNIDDIDSPVPAFLNYYWQPEQDDKLKQAIFTWEKPQHIEQAVLYSSIDSESTIKELTIILDDESVYTVKDISNDGQPCYIDLGRHDNITKCTIRIVSYEGSGYGLAECEFFASSEMISGIAPFLKMVQDDNFLYEYVIGLEVKSITLGLYLFGIDDADKCTFEIMRGGSKIDGNKILIDPSDKEIVVRCSSERCDAWDQIVIKRLDENELAARVKDDKADADYLIRERARLKVHNMFYILTRQGPYAVIKRAFKNVILPKLRKKYGR